MSKTDKTRPGWIQEKDPLNQRFRRVVNQEYDWFWKRMHPLRGCWCCSQKRYYAAEQATDRMLERELCRKLEKGDFHDLGD